MCSDELYNGDECEVWSRNEEYKDARIAYFIDSVEGKCYFHEDQDESILIGRTGDLTTMGIRIWDNYLLVGE